MKKAVLSTIILSHLFLSAFSQTPLPRKCYMHLKGAINKELPLTIDLVKISDSLYCDYSCDKSAFEQSNCTAPIGDIESVSGKMTGVDSFQWKSMFNDDGPCFKGRFTSEQKLSGSWVCGKNGEMFSFEATEKYPAGSIPFNLHYLKEKKTLTTKLDSPAASIQLALLMPAEAGNAAISDTLGNIILQFFSDKLSHDSTPDGILNSMKKRFFENYLNSNESSFEAKTGGPNQNWELLKFMHILHNADYVVSFYILSYAFTGGAHGLETQEYGVVDLKKGRLLQLQDIFRENYEKDLSLLLTKKLHQIANLQDSQKLSEAGYFMDEIKPIENFYQTGKGIGFFYNHYDIAPYSFGSTDIFLTLEELRDLLK